MSNPAPRTPLYSPSALALLPKLSTAASTQPAPKWEISTSPQLLYCLSRTMPQLFRRPLGRLQRLHSPPYTSSPYRPQRPGSGGSCPCCPLPPSLTCRSPAAVCRPGCHGHPVRQTRTTRTSCTRPPPGLQSPLEFATPRAPLRPALIGPSGPPSGPVAPNPMGSPAPPWPPEISCPRSGKCLTTPPLYLGAGPPRVICPSFNTTASGAGMCFFPC